MKTRRYPKEIIITFNESALNKVTSYVLGDKNKNERICFILCGWTWSENEFRYFSKEIVIPSKAEIVSQTNYSIVPSATLHQKLLNRCVRENLALISVHSHQFSNDAKFSAIDDKADFSLNHIMSNIYPELPPFVSLLVGRKKIIGRFIADNLSFREIKRIVRIGLHYDYNILDKDEQFEIDFSKIRFDRQLRFLGAEGQRDLCDINVFIAGLGGIGSIAAQQLARLGVTNFYLCDGDKVKESNLNRLVGVFPNDIGKYKVDAIEELIQFINKDAKVIKLSRQVFEAMEEIKRVDFIFGCVDSEAARIFLNDVSVRYLIPYLDFGSAIFMDNNMIRGMKGQFRLVVPAETQCLVCNDDINFTVAENENMEAEIKKLEKNAGYIIDERQIPTPSVISLNSVIFSLGLIEFMKLISGFSIPENYLFYDALFQRMEKIETHKNSNCPVCSKNGFLALGDSSQGDLNVKISSEEEKWLSKIKEKRLKFINKNE